MLSSWQQPGPVTEIVPAETKQEPWEYILRKYILMLATLVVTVTYGVGFNPPGGVWQDNVDGHLAGESIVRTTNNLSYLVFFYCNAVSLASSVVVLCHFLILSNEIIDEKDVWIGLKPLRALMVLDLLSFLGAYAAGSCRDRLTIVYTSVLMAGGVSTYLTVQMRLALRQPLESHPPAENINLRLEGRLRKVLMLLSMFAVSITYASGLNSPGGFWDNTAGAHRAGDAILSEGHHKARLATFFICNTTTFIAALLIIMLLLSRKLHQRTVRSLEMFVCVVVALVGLIGAYASGSCREIGATAYVLLVVAAASLVCILLQPWLQKDKDSQPSLENGSAVGTGSRTIATVEQINYAMEERSKQSQSLLLLLATFATAITYQAGLDPPGGVWQDNTDGHLAGDPILFVKNASRYRTFLYCNSYALLSSLVAIVIFLRKLQLKRRVVDKVIILELFGLIGAYAAGACRDISTSNAVLALAAAVLFYVVIHVAFCTLEHDYGDNYHSLALVDKKRKLLYLLATLSTAMSYQAGLNPPGGFWLQDRDADDHSSGHNAGDPVLSYTNPRHYKAFFYCNSVSFMSSVATMILLVSPVLYRPAIRSYALSLCTMAGLLCLMGAYVAGSTQHLATSIAMCALMAMVFFIIVILVLVFLLKEKNFSRTLAAEPHRIVDEEPELKQLFAKCKHLMLLGILLAGVTYQAGLDPPGGVWQSDASRHDAGGPAMQDNRRQRYLAFFYSNSTSFAASIIILLLLLQRLMITKTWLHSWPMRTVVELDLVALLVAYTAGSLRDWKSFLFVAALVLPVFTYIAVKVMSSFCCKRRTAQFEGRPV